MVAPAAPKLAAEIKLVYKFPMVAPATPILPALTKAPTNVAADTVPLNCAFAEVIDVT